MGKVKMEVQLIIKAPSPSIEDHVINCCLDWSVRRLKRHLSNVYYNKPAIKDQKLIYSGRLLHDDLHLRDILRREDGQPSVHILHLVCGGRSAINEYQTPSSSQNWSNQPILSQPESTANNPIINTSESNLRNRDNPQIQSSSFYQPVYSGMPQSVPSMSVPGDPQVLAQLAAMQQMYAYYFTQYIQSMNNAVVMAGPNTQPVHDTNAMQNNNAQRQANVGEPFLDDNEENRDWLDNFFFCCRFLILFSIIYYYSTPERLMIVIVLAIVAFLYHEGWFVRRPAAAPRQRNQGNGNPVVLNNRNPEDNQNADANEADLQDGHEIEAVMDGDDPPHAQNPDMANNNSGFSPFTYISAFFSSLIPDPPPPVNFN